MTAIGGTLLFCLFFLSPLLIYGNESRDPILHHVGDDAGWTNGINWPRPGQTFLAGDVLVFKYRSEKHNVVRVDADGYTTCTVPENPMAHTSGLDFITLNPGTNYFICGISSHCRDAGMRIAVTTY